MAPEPDETAPDQILVDNGTRKLTLDELGRSQPGMGRLMPEVGARTWKAWYAAEAGNWRLARWQLSEAAKLMELGAFVRPKYQVSMAKFLTEDFDPVRKAVEDRDWEAFRGHFDRMVVKANFYHDVFDKGFIQWKLPAMPPPDLDLTPRE
ncbi:MAG: hypothetical protein QOE93_848 [Actinomycetota bacterium]|jgi:hypothetical protein|nr:hypothetical protein [Actinomycetota bacterium]